MKEQTRNLILKVALVWIWLVITGALWALVAYGLMLAVTEASRYVHRIPVVILLILGASPIALPIARRLYRYIYRTIHWSVK